MCGGSSQTQKQSSTYAPTAEAGQLYSNIIDMAGTAAGTPYNPATGQQVAGFTPDQLAAFGDVNAAQGAWSPYIDQAAGYAESAAGPITTEQIQQYMDPYQQNVIDAAIAQITRQNQMQQSQLKGNAVASGAFGGNAPGINAAVLAGEQGRNLNSTIAGLMSGGFNTALQAAQADATRRQNAASQFGQLGQTVQGLTMNDIMARLGIGNQQQAQTQAGLDAATANAQAETMWPYQNAQWLASIGSAIGPLTGGTTTGTTKTDSGGKGIGNIIGAGLSAAASLSDRRAKRDIRRVGYTDDGQPLYKYRLAGSPRFQIGLMADEVEKRHPEAVEPGPHGMKMVNYDEATDFADGGSVFGSDTSFFPWAPLGAAQPVMPQLSGMGAAPSGQQSIEESVAYGKKLGSGLDNIARYLDPAGGWGASLESASGGGKGLGAIGSLFGFADGGSVNLAALSPNIFDIYGERPKLPPLLENEDIGEIGPMPDNLTRGGIDIPTQPDELSNPDPMTPALQIGEPQRTENIGQVGASGIRSEVPWYQQSLTDLLGITEGQSDPGARLALPGREDARSARADAAREDYLLNHAVTPGDGWSLENGVVKYGGKSLRDYLMGPREPEGASAPNATDPFANPEMVYGTGLDELDLTPRAEAPPMDIRPPVMQGASPGTAPLSTLDFIKQQEGYTPEAKWDRRQYSSGYGTRARAGETIDRNEAERRLKSEVGKVESWIDNNITAELSPTQRTGLVSFGYNLGTDDLEKLKSDINAGDFGRVAARMKSFNKALNEDSGELEVVDGLTARRGREASLVSGGASLPDMQALTSRATDPQAPAQGRYKGKEDRETGGLLKRLFGYDFNPLKLSEDERMAMLVAGLSMMSHGDVGKGGLQGLQYLQNRQDMDRKSAIESAKLALDLYKTDISAQSSALTNDQKDYRAAKAEGFGGNFMDYMRSKETLKASKIPSEAGGRLGLGRAFQADAPKIKEQLRAITAKDRVDMALGRGDAADLQRRIGAGMEALVRSMTGAAMPESERATYEARYMPQSTDTTETMLRKFDLLTRDLQAAQTGILEGATGGLTRPFQSGQTASRPRARNAAGDVVEYDGRAWVPVTATGF